MGGKVLVPVTPQSDAMKKPIVFIPGFPASELRDASGIVFPPSPADLIFPDRKAAFIAKMLDIPGTLKPGGPIRSVLGIAKQAQSLYDLLGRRGYAIAHDGNGPDFRAVGWDWRLGIDDTQTMDAVAAAVESFKPRKVVMLVHSTGALVFRAFLEAHPALEDRIEHVLAFGGAWCGTLEALYAVHHGHSESIFGIPLLSADDGAKLIGHAQAAYDLFPPDPTRTEMDEVQLVHDANGTQVSANVNLAWIKQNRPYAEPLARSANARLGERSRQLDLPVTNVVGWGGPTWPSAVLGNHDVVFGAPDKDAGDGTVPLVSASWIDGPAVRTIVVPIGAFVANPIPDLHAHLWESLAVTQIFKEVLEDAAPGPFIAAAADSDEAIDYDSEFVTVRLTAQTNDGDPLPGCVALARLGPIPTSVPFNGRTRAILRVRRAGFQHNAGNDVFRFTIDFKWQGGAQNNLAVSFRAP
jgi:pimeloyl-ACP methyl ester carboxylesterase